MVPTRLPVALVGVPAGESHPARPLSGTVLPFPHVDVAIGPDVRASPVDLAAERLADVEVATGKGDNPDFPGAVRHSYVEDAKYCTIQGDPKIKKNKLKNS